MQPLTLTLYHWPWPSPTAGSLRVTGACAGDGLAGPIAAEIAWLVFEAGVATGSVGRQEGVRVVKRQQRRQLLIKAVGVIWCAAAAVVVQATCEISLCES